MAALNGRAATHTLDCEEVQFLVESPEDAVYYYFHYVGLIRVSRATWIVCDPDGEVTQKNLENVEVIPLLRDAEFPLENRPFRIHRADQDLLPSRTRARQLADLLGIATAASTGPRSSNWFSRILPTNALEKFWRTRSLTIQGRWSARDPKAAKHWWSCASPARMRSGPSRRA